MALPGRRGSTVADAIEPDPVKRRSDARVAATLAKLVSSDVDRETGLVTIMMSHKDSTLARFVVSQLVAEVTTVFQQAVMSQVTDTRRSVARRLDAASSRLRDAERRSQQFAASNRQIAPYSAAALEKERLAREKESLGFYLSGHPFEKRGAFLARIAGQTTASLAKLEPGGTTRIAGMISSVRVLQIKQGKNAGQKMARFQLEDRHGQVAVTCFARSYANLKDRIVDDAIVFLTGRLDANSEEKALLLDQLDPANEVIRREVAGLVVHLRGVMAAEANLERVAAVCARHKGHQHLLLDVEDGADCYRVRADDGVRVTDELLDELSLLVGPENLSFTRT